MENSFIKRNSFLIFIFILFTVFLNIPLIFILDTLTPTQAFFGTYSFWFIIIITLYFASKKILKSEGE